MNASLRPSRSRPATLLAALMTACMALTLSGLSGCVHRIDIQQGNFLDSEDIDRVSVGMTRVQVRSLLGTPMVADPFKTSRWDYVYYLKQGRLKRPQQRHFIVFFGEGDKVARIERPIDTTKSKSS
jgi:outer membrane protein assembly factor BamE